MFNFYEEIGKKIKDGRNKEKRWKKWRNCEEKSIFSATHDECPVIWTYIVS